MQASKILLLVSVFELPLSEANNPGRVGSVLNSTSQHYSSNSLCQGSVCTDGTEYCGGAVANTASNGTAELIYYASPSSFNYGNTNRGTGTPQTINYNSSVSYTYQGCYDSLGPINPPRFLYGLAANSSINSVTLCAQVCGSHNYAANLAPYSYFGLDRGQFCTCGSNPDVRSQLLNTNACNLTCAGDSTQICGGPLSNGNAYGAVSFYALSTLPLWPTSP